MNYFKNFIVPPSPKEVIRSTFFFLILPFTYIIQNSKITIHFIIQNGTWTEFCWIFRILNYRFGAPRNKQNAVSITRSERYMFDEGFRNRGEKNDNVGLFIIHLLRVSLLQLNRTGVPTFGPTADTKMFFKILCNRVVQYLSLFYRRMTLCYHSCHS